MMDRKPYIGITDFQRFGEVLAMLGAFKHLKPKGSNRQLHVGVMMSYKTLHGLETKWSKAFPPKERIACIFGDDEAFNCLHYADYDHREDIWKDLVSAIGYGGIGIHAIQLDMVWPEPSEIASAVHASRKSLEVILQVNSNAMEEVGGTPEGVVRKLREYEGVIHRVLLDKSMGRGLGMDAQELLVYAEAINTALPGIDLVFAGGLGPDTIGLLEPVLERFPQASWDAQSRLRRSGSALDPIDWDLASIYLAQSLKRVQ